MKIIFKVAVKKLTATIQIFRVGEKEKTFSFNTQPQKSIADFKKGARLDPPPYCDILISKEYGGKYGKS